jgi:cytochrome c553
MKIPALVALFVLSAATGMSLAAGDPAAGKSKSAACAACHGMNGVSANPEWPSLAGQHAGYLAKQLHDFKAGRRENALMAGQVAALSEQDMADLAAYYASLTPPGGSADPAQVQLGQSIYRAGNPKSGVSACIACHSPTGAGNPQAGFPKVAGQHATYTSNQLKMFRAGQRANDAAQMMRKVAGKLTDAEMDAVAQYLQGLY